MNVGGIVTICGFDKTGTLTESGLEVYGCKPFKGNGFGKRCNMNVLNEHFLTFFNCMASCHSITQINGETMGDPLDIKMFEATKLKLNGSEILGNKLALNIK